MVFHRREGDPRREPWIAPPSWRPGGVETLWLERADPGRWTYLAEPPGVVRYLERLARPVSSDGKVVGIGGLGRVGGVAATSLASMPTSSSGVREILVYDVDGANLERWLLELGSIGVWRGEDPLPRVRPTSPEQVFHQCDLFLFVASTGVPPLGSEGDVRLVQFEPNRAVLRGFLEQARRAQFTGLFLVVSDPVDWLAQAAFVDSNTDEAGHFTGSGLAPERLAGLGLGVMWGRALAAARREGWDPIVSRAGGTYGPHTAEVLAFDDLRRPSPQRCSTLTQAARECNYLVRHLGFLPYVGPGVSSVGLAVPRMLGGGELLASALVDGLYFGAPCRLELGILPVARPMEVGVRKEIAALYAGQRERARRLGLLL
jgi:hypothetical protein